MKEEIIDLMRSRNLDRIHLEYLIDLGDEYDCDGDVFAITCDTIVIEDDDNIIIYDSNNENEDGSVDKEDKYFFDDFDEDQQKDTLWALDATLEYLDKNK